MWRTALPIFLLRIREVVLLLLPQAKTHYASAGHDGAHQARDSSDEERGPGSVFIGFNVHRRTEEVAEVRAPGIRERTV